MGLPLDSVAFLTFLKLIVEKFYKRLFPVIVAGFFMSIIWRIVGAMSAREPGGDLRFKIKDLRLGSEETKINGTWFRVWAVCFSPVLTSILTSSLPWSAVIIAAPPIEVIFSTTLFSSLSTVSTAVIIASRFAECTTISALAKFNSKKSSPALILSIALSAISLAR